MKNITLLLLFISLTSCGGKKVTLTKDEKKQITISKEQRYVYKSETGIRDTIFIKKGTDLSTFEKRLAIGFSKVVYNDDVEYTSIPFEESYGVPYSFEHGEFKKDGINLSVKIVYSKQEADEGVTLEIRPFSEKYILNDDPNKEYVFEQNKNYNPDLCDPSVLGCLKKVVYARNKGILLVEKEDTGVWKLIERIE